MKKKPIKKDWLMATNKVIKMVDTVLISPASTYGLFPDAPYPIARW
jgi:hypothetical protein